MAFTAGAGFEPLLTAAFSLEPDFCRAPLEHYRADFVSRDIAAFLSAGHGSIGSDNRPWPTSSVVRRCHGHRNTFARLFLV
jgi:hypothetical protein